MKALVSTKRGAAWKGPGPVAAYEGARCCALCRKSRLCGASCMAMGAAAGWGRGWKPLKCGETIGALPDGAGGLGMVRVM
jgi:hypothetical protein